MARTGGSAVPVDGSADSEHTPGASPPGTRRGIGSESVSPLDRPFGIPQGSAEPKLAVQNRRLFSDPRRDWRQSVGTRETDMDVMRQPLTTIIVGLGLILATTARGGTAPVAGPEPISQARRLIEAGDHAAALTILEDALLEATAKDRPTILDLLRQSYEVLAKKAEASGKPRDAAHYRDNLAILGQSREPESPARPAEPRSQTPVRPKDATTGMAPSQVRRSDATAMSAAPGPILPVLAEPTPLPEPERLPAPETMGSRDPVRAGSEARTPAPSTPIAIPARDGTRPPGPARLASPVRTRPGPRGTTMTPANAPLAGLTRLPDAGLLAAPRPGSERDHPSEGPNSAEKLAHGQDPELADGTPAEINPGAAMPEGSPAPPAEPNPGAAIRPEEAGNPAAAREGPAVDSELERADRLFTAKQYDEAGRLYAALAGQDKLPTERRPHWAYCRASEVVRKINAHPRSAREWDEIEADVQMIQSLTPGNWVGEYLRNLVAEGRGGARRPLARSKGLIVRGSEPEESPEPKRPIPRRFGRPRGAASPQPDAATPAPRPAPAPERPLSLPSPAKQADTFLALNVAPGSGGEIGTAPASSKSTTDEAPNPIDGGSPKRGSRMRRRGMARARRTPRSIGRSSKRTISGSSTTTRSWPDARRRSPSRSDRPRRSDGPARQLARIGRLDATCISIRRRNPTRRGPGSRRSRRGSRPCRTMGCASCHAG